MTTDVIVTKTESIWIFEPVTSKANAQFHGHTFKPETIEETQKLILWCSEIGLTVESPALTLSYWQPTLRKISKTRRRRHNVAA
jgi:hypothetical protein